MLIMLRVRVFRICCHAGTNHSGCGFETQAQFETGPCEMLFQILGILISSPAASDISACISYTPSSHATTLPSQNPNPSHASARLAPHFAPKPRARQSSPPLRKSDQVRSKVYNSTRLLNKKKMKLGFLMVEAASEAAAAAAAEAAIAGTIGSLQGCSLGCGLPSCTTSFNSHLIRPRYSLLDLYLYSYEILIYDYYGYYISQYYKMLKLQK